MKWIRTMVCALGMLACVSLSAFAAEYGEPNITTKTTMKELRENPSIKGSGYYTYCNEWIEGSTQYDDTPIEGYVSYAAAEDAAEGMNLVIENYNRGVQITWQVYTPEEIAEILLWAWCSCIIFRLKQPTQSTPSWCPATAATPPQS